MALKNLNSTQASTNFSLIQGIYMGKWACIE